MWRADDLQAQHSRPSRLWYTKRVTLSFTKTPSVMHGPKPENSRRVLLVTRRFRYRIGRTTLIARLTRMEMGAESFGGNSVRLARLALLDAGWPRRVQSKRPAGVDVVGATFSAYPGERAGPERAGGLPIRSRVDL
jgi:hypothetical protein